MTFKHTNFQDSPIMRSLEKVAQEKGLIKSEPLTKTAAVKKIDLTPTTSLMDNVLKLCAGLRERGFEKQANELEVNLVNYKRAQTLYETTPEKGEDLVHAAHPKGSHKLEDVDSDEAVFEDILDQMAKAIQMVEKKPTGKLSSANAITSVKQVLAQSTEKKNPPSEVSPGLSGLPAEQLESIINNSVNKAVGVVGKVAEIVKPEMTIFSDVSRKLEAIQEAAKNTTVDSLQEMADQIGYLTTRVKPGSWTTLGMGGITENTWATVEPMLAGATRLVNTALQARKLILGQQAAAIANSFDNVDQPSQAKPANGPSEQLIQKYNDAIQTIGLYKARIQSKGLANAAALINWLDNQALPYAQKNLDDYSKSQFKDDTGVTSNYAAKLNALQTRLGAFQQKWSI